MSGFDSNKTHLPICCSTSAASAGVARGNMPGSVNDVRNRQNRTNKNRKAATIGTNGLILLDRYGELNGAVQPNYIQWENQSENLLKNKEANTCTDQ